MGGYEAALIVCFNTSIMTKPKWYLYIIQCCDKRFYTGITINVARRFEAHCGKGQAGAKYVRTRRPLKLVYQTKIGIQSLAMKVERKIKSLPKSKKEMLVAGALDIKAIIKMVQKKGNRSRPLNPPKGDL